MLLAGLDEAGLGPLLGPLCIGSALLPQGYVHEPPSIFTLKDSKTIYKGHRASLHQLERTALILFYWAYERLPTSIEDWLTTLLGEIHIDLNSPDFQAPWLAQLSHIMLPLDDSVLVKEVEDTAQQLLRQFGACKLALNVVSALQLNRSLDLYQNKATCVQKFYQPLLLYALERSNDIVIDRQGGRRYYAEQCLSLADILYGENNTKIEILMENSLCSHYIYDNKQMRFIVRSESQFPQVAAAAILAKYTREILMRHFNNYWQKEVINLQPTAGYYVDGKRFCKDIACSPLYEEYRRKAMLTRNK